MTSDPGGSDEWPTLSIIIANYNYARFLPIAIESVLSQDCAAELIVVDDASTDGSQAVLEDYADRATILLSARNGGQADAFNRGVARSSGTLVWFLDADDFLLPGAVRTVRENAVRGMASGVALYHYRMRYSDESGNLRGCHPVSTIPLAAGDLVQQLCERGRYFGTVTSGLVYAHAALRQVLPIEVDPFRYSADGYLCVTVPFYGRSASHDTFVSAYRLHADQQSRFRGQLAERARYRIFHDYDRFRHLRHHARLQGLQVRPDLHDRDPDHLQERLVSLLNAPTRHPVHTDTVRFLVSQLRSVLGDGASPDANRATSAFWFAFGWLPRHAQRLVLSWKAEAGSRPAWLRVSAGLLRRRLGLALR